MRDLTVVSILVNFFNPENVQSGVVIRIFRIGEIETD